MNLCPLLGTLNCKLGIGLTQLVDLLFCLFFERLEELHVDFVKHLTQCLLIDHALVKLYQLLFSSIEKIKLICAFILISI